MPTPTKFKAEVKQKIIQALSVGASRRTAAAVAGIDESNLRRWMERGKNASEGTAYREFHDDVIAAEAAPRIRALGVVYKELPDNPGLAWKFLERREPGYAPPMPTLPTGPAPVLVQLNFHDGTSAGEQFAAQVIEGTAIEQDEATAEITALPAPSSA